MTKTELHPRNPHRERYDFPKLIGECPELKAFVSKNAYGDESIDFSNPEAVKVLNRALLKHFYGIHAWDIPDQYLCPPIPGRADYIHTAADLLAEKNRGEVPKGRNIRVLDIGTGANLVYPLIAQATFGWSMVGSDIDERALQSASRILSLNPEIRGEPTAIELRHQPREDHLFPGIIKSGEFFHLSVCNPPFYSSFEEAQAGSERKWRGLGKKRAPEPEGRRPFGKKPTNAKVEAPHRNFGGVSHELWCEGGERDFIVKMIDESNRYSQQVGWFTSLVSRETSLPTIENTLKRTRVTDARLIEMSQGQKKSRIVAWTFI
jgi:23S rRNA (adenine1618-N6)-methyltransferase